MSIEKIKKFGWVIGSVTVIGGLTAVNPKLMERIGCEIVDWGPGFGLAALVMYGLYLLANSVGLKILAGLEKPAEALGKQAEALTKQSISMDHLTTALQNYVDRDQTDHREILILLKVVAERVNNLREIKDGKDGN